MMKRREFLMSSALLASAAAGYGVARPAEPIRCGVLGLGHAHALDVTRVLMESADYEFVGVCEPDAGIRASRANSAVLEDVAWLSQDELLGDDTVRMVAVESHVLHSLGLAQAAAEAGKHIHLDKPAGCSLEDFRRLLDTMESRELMLLMGYMFRYNAGYDFARAAVRDGLIGDVYRVSGCMDTDYTDARRKDLHGRPGGMMFELGCHMLDVTMLMLGVPAKVTPFLRQDVDSDNALLDNTAAVFEFEGAMAILQSSAMRPNAGRTRRFEVCGTDGSIVIEPMEPPSVLLNLREARGGFERGIQEVEVAHHRRHVRDLENFAKCIRGEKEFEFTKRHDYEVQKALLLASF